MEVYEPDVGVIAFLEKQFGCMNTDSNDWKGAGISLGLYLGEGKAAYPQLDQRALEYLAAQGDYLAIINQILENNGKSRVDLIKTPQGIKVKSNNQEIGSFKFRVSKKTKDSMIYKTTSALILSELAPCIFQELSGYKPFPPDYTANPQAEEPQKSGYPHQDMMENAEMTTQDNMSELPALLCEPVPVMCFFESMEESKVNQSLENPKRSSSGEYRTLMNRQPEVSIVTTSHRTRSHSHDSRTMRMDRQGNLHDHNDGEDDAPEATPDHPRTVAVRQDAQDLSDIILTPETRLEIGLEASDAMPSESLIPSQQIGDLSIQYSGVAANIACIQERDTGNRSSPEVLTSSGTEFAQEDETPPRVPRVDTPVPDFSGSALQSESRTHSDNSQQIGKEEHLPSQSASVLALFVSEVITPFIGVCKSVPAVDSPHYKNRRFDISQNRRIVNSLNWSFFEEAFSVELVKLLFDINLRLTEAKYSFKSQDSKYVTQELIVRCGTTSKIKLIHRLQVLVELPTSLSAKIRRFHMLTTYFPEIAAKIASNSLDSCFKRVFAQVSPLLPPVSGFAPSLGPAEPAPVPATPDQSRRDTSPKTGKITVAVAQNSPVKFTTRDMPQTKAEILQTATVKRSPTPPEPAPLQPPSVPRTPVEQSLLLDSISLPKVHNGISAWKQRGVDHTRTIDSLAISVIEKGEIEDISQMATQTPKKRWVLTPKEAQERYKNINTTTPPNKDRENWPSAEYRKDNPEAFEAKYFKPVVSQRYLTVGDIFFSTHCLNLRVSLTPQQVEVWSELIKKSLSNCVATSLQNFFKVALGVNLQAIGIGSTSVILISDKGERLLWFQITPTGDLTEKRLLETALIIFLRIIFKPGYQLFLKQFPNFGS